MASKGDLDIEVRMTFGQRVQGSEGPNVTRRIKLESGGSDSILEIKKKVAAAFGNKVSQHELQLYFGPNEAVMGVQYQDDPAVDESKLKLSQFSFLPWIQQFPHWHLSVRFMPATPLPPGVAAHRAAALSEGKDPDIAVKDARNKGEIPSLTSLPKPWGPKAFEASESDKSHTPPAAFSLQRLAIE